MLDKRMLYFWGAGSFGMYVISHLIVPTEPQPAWLSAAIVFIGLAQAVE